MRGNAEICCHRGMQVSVPGLIGLTPKLQMKFAESKSIGMFKTRLQINQI